MRLIQLPGDSPTLYVSKSSFLQSDSSWFDWNDEQAVLFPNWETGITWFESGITSSSQLLWDLFNFLVILQYFMYPNQASCKVINFRFFSFYYIALAPEILFQPFKAKPEIWNKRKKIIIMPINYTNLLSLHICVGKGRLWLCVLCVRPKQSRLTREVSWIFQVQTPTSTISHSTEA